MAFSTSSPIIDLRKMVADYFASKQQANAFVLNDFVLQETYYPISRVKDFPVQGMVWVMGMAGDDINISRSDPSNEDNGLVQREQPVQIAIQYLLPANPRELTTIIDQLIVLEQQLREAVGQAAAQTEGWAWTRNEALKDPNGTPFTFQGMREQNTFEAYFTAYFTVVY